MIASAVLQNVFLKYLQRNTSLPWESSGLIFAHRCLGKLTAHRFQIDTTFYKWPTLSVIRWHPRTGVSLPVAPPSDWWLISVPSVSDLSQPPLLSIAANLRKHEAGCKTRVLVAVTCYGTRVDRWIPSLTLASYTPLYLPGFTFLAWVLHPWAQILAQAAGVERFWRESAWLGLTGCAAVVRSISWWFEQSWIAPWVCHLWICGDKLSFQEVCDGKVFMKITLANKRSTLRHFSLSNVDIGIQQLFPVLSRRKLFYLIYFYPARWHNLCCWNKEQTFKCTGTFFPLQQQRGNRSLFGLKDFYQRVFLSVSNPGCKSSASTSSSYVWRVKPADLYSHGASFRYLRGTEGALHCVERCHIATVRTLFGCVLEGPKASEISLLQFELFDFSVNFILTKCVQVSSSDHRKLFKWTNSGALADGRGSVYSDHFDTWQASVDGGLNTWKHSNVSKL